MPLSGFDPISLALAFALLALLPTIAVVSTTFLKLMVVMSLLSASKLRMETTKHGTHLSGAANPLSSAYRSRYHGERVAVDREET